MSMRAVPPVTAQHLRRALQDYGRLARLTSFTALHGYGIRGWERGEIHLAVPPGTERIRRLPGTPPVVLHHSDAIVPARDMLAERCSTAAVRAAGSLRSARQACGLLACVVAQTGTSVAELTEAASVAHARRHRRTALVALADMALGARALTGIDFHRLCDQNELPGPTWQQIRLDEEGRRRHLWAVWHLGDENTLVVDVDAALDQAPPRWWADRVPPFVAATAGSVTLRCPSAIVRHEPQVVLAPLRRALREGRAA